MRKFISLVMALAMIISAMAMTTISAGAEMLDGEDGIDYVEALYFETAPTIDGYITEAEWGEVTVHLQNDWCATKDNRTPYYNTFFYWKAADSLENHPMEADVWLRWDENNYYVGVKVKDFDGHSLKHGKNETWNGDAIQFRVDSEGPNAATGGDVYDPDIGTPWSDADQIPDIIAGYVQIAGGFVECYDNANYKGLTAYSKPVFGAVDVAVAPSEVTADNPLGYHDDAANGYTTYELAIPWKYVFQNNLVPNYGTLTEAEKAPYVLKYAEYDFKNEPYGGIGYCLGMSLTVFNAAKGESTWNAFMSWGSGTTNIQTQKECHQTAAGSNCVTLSAEKVTPGSYTKYDPAKLEAVKLDKTYDNVYYDYLGDDLDRANPLNSADKLTSLTYDEDADMDFWGSAEFFMGSTVDVGGDHGKVLSFDRVTETHKDEETGKTFTAGVDPIDQFYIDTRLNDDGTSALNYPLSYTFEFDIMYTGNEIVQDGRASELGNWFGGANAVSYYCGYSFNDKKFIINDVTDPTTWIASKDYDLKKDTWYNWKFQYDNDSCTVRLLINDEVIFNVYNRYFYYSSEQHINEGTMMIFWFINTQMKMDNVKVYNFFDYVHKDSTNVENNNQGGSVVKPPVTQEGGDKVEIKDDDVVTNDDGTFELTINGKDAYKTITSLSYKFSFDATRFEFKGVTGLEEGDYTIEQGEDGMYTLTIKAIDKIKSTKTGEKAFGLKFLGKNGATKEELAKNFKAKDTYTFVSPSTGDSAIYVAVIAAVMLAGCAVVVSKKRRSF